jgi:hypothetical protein
MEISDSSRLFGQFVRSLVSVSVACSLVLFLASCASGSVVVLKEERIRAARVVALDAPLAPWVPQIEKRLKQHGFQVKRISRDQTGSLANLGARYVLRLTGDYHTGWERRCLGGGYRLQGLTAELLDLETNEALASTSGEGYSEDCPPLSGSIFGDVASMVADRWE